MNVARKITALGLFFTALTLTGCAAVQKLDDKLSYRTGSYVTVEQFNSLQKGKTTQDQAIQIIGFPHDKLNVSGKELWRYPYAKINAIPFAGENQSETTVLEFNSKGVLINAYKTAGSQGSSDNPLLKAAGH